MTHVSHYYTTNIILYCLNIIGLSEATPTPKQAIPTISSSTQQQGTCSKS